MSNDSPADGSGVSPSGGRTMLVDIGKIPPYTPLPGGSFSGSSSSANRSFADVYPSGVAPCYSQGLICIDGDCICHAFKVGNNMQTLQPMRVLRSGLPKTGLDDDSDSGGNIVCKAPEDTVINRTSVSRLSEGSWRNNFEITRSQAVNETNFVQGYETPHGRFLGGAITPERFRATLTAQFNALSSLRDQIEKDTIEKSRSERPVAKP